MKSGYFNYKSNTPGMGSMTIIFDVGATIETEGYRGICHLSEHLLCKPLMKIEEEMDRFGVTFNAATGDSRTYFYIEGLDENVKKFEKNLLEVIKYIPSKEDFEKEKKIVLSEYDDTFTNKNCLYYNIWRNYFGTYSSIGLRKDIEYISYENFVKFVEKWYSKPTCIIRVGENCQEIPIITYDLHETKSYEMFNRNLEPETFYSSQRIFAIDWFLSNSNKYLNEFLITYLNYGLVSPLLKRIREELGLVYYIGMYNTELGDKQFISLSYEADNKKLKVIRKEIKKLFKEKDLINENRFNATKDIIKSLYVKKEIFNFKNNNVMDVYDGFGDHIDYITNLNYETFKKEFREFLDNFLKNNIHSTIQKRIKL